MTLPDLRRFAESNVSQQEDPIQFLATRTHRTALPNVSRQDIRNFIKFERFAAPLKPLQRKALHTTSVEYNHRHIPSSTFFNVSVVLVTCVSILSWTFSIVSHQNSYVHIALSHLHRNCCLHHKHIAQHLHQIDHHVFAPGGFNKL